MHVPTKYWDLARTIFNIFRWRYTRSDPVKKKRNPSAHTRCFSTQMPNYQRRDSTYELEVGRYRLCRYRYDVDISDPEYRRIYIDVCYFSRPTSGADVCVLR